MAEISKNTTIGELLTVFPDGDRNALSRLPVCTDGIFGRGCNGPWNQCRSARREDQCCKESDAGLILKFNSENIE